MRLKTLGELTLEGSSFKQSRPLLVLAYLCLQGAQARRHLAELFWSRSPNAVRNLTTVLSRLKKVDAGLILTEKHKLSTSLSCDALDLLKAYEQRDYPKVIEQYQGRFLEGFHLKGIGTEIEEWLYETREALASKVRFARLSQAETKAQQGLFREAAKGAEAAYFQAGAGEPTESDLARIYNLLVAGDSQLAFDVKKEAQPFGIELLNTKEEAQQQFIASLAVSDHEMQSKESTNIPHNLPKQATPFVGRQQELGHLHNQLNDPDCFLLSLIGPGGMGKTRLALALAEQHLKASPFKDGVYFISFVAVPSPDQMVLAMGDALGLMFSGSIEPKAQLLNFLASKTMLLVLDNLEHLLAGVGLFSELLERAPSITLLVTSREPLHLSAEHVVDIAGLAVPNNERLVEDSDAVKLFVQRAKMHQSTFTLDKANSSEIVRICALVEGMPLALELAAAWLRVLPLTDIAFEINQNLDILKASNRDLPERHRSIRAVFDYSWELLSPSEQDALRKLAVFRGGFTRDAAKGVADVGLPVLASLIDKSFLSTTDSGRYRRHPLVIQYSQEKLEEYPEEKREAEEKHGLHFLEHVRQHAPKMRSLERKATLALLEPDFPNIKAAWAWAVKHQHIEVLTSTTEALSEMFRNHNSEVVELFQQVVTGMDESNPLHHQVLGYALIYQAKSWMRLDRHVLRWSVAQKGLALLRPLDDKRGMVLALLETADDRGTLKTAVKQGSPYQAGLKLARKYGTPTDICDYLNHQLLYSLQFDSHVDRDAELKQQFMEALAEVSALGDQINLASIRLLFGAYLVYQKQFDKGRQALLESLALIRELDAKEYYEAIYVELGYAAFKLGHFQEAEAYFQDSLRSALQTGSVSFQAKSLGYLARLALARNNTSSAQRYFKEGLQLAAFISFKLEVLVGFAEYLMRIDDPVRAAKLLQFILKHPYTEKRDRNQAQELLDELETQVSQESFEAAQENSMSLTLEEVIQDALSFL